MFFFDFFIFPSVLFYLRFFSISFFLVLFLLAFLFIFIFLVLFLLAFLFIFFKKQVLYISGWSKVTRFTVGRHTDQSFGVCDVNLATLKVAMKKECTLYEVCFCKIRLARFKNWPFPSGPLPIHGWKKTRLGHVEGRLDVQTGPVHRLVFTCPVHHRLLPVLLQLQTLLQQVCHQHLEVFTIHSRLPRALSPIHWLFFCVVQKRKKRQTSFTSPSPTRQRWPVTSNTLFWRRVWLPQERQLNNIQRSQRIALPTNSALEPYCNHVDCLGGQLRRHPVLFGRLGILPLALRTRSTVITSLLLLTVAMFFAFLDPPLLCSIVFLSSSHMLAKCFLSSSSPCCLIFRVCTM